MSAYGVRESLYQANSDRMFRHGQVAVQAARRQRRLRTSRPTSSGWAARARRPSRRCPWRRSARGRATRAARASTPCRAAPRHAPRRRRARRGRALPLLRPGRQRPGPVGEVAGHVDDRRPRRRASTTGASATARTGTSPTPSCGRRTSTSARRRCTRWRAPLPQRDGRRQRHRRNSARRRATSASTPRATTACIATPTRRSRSTAGARCPSWPSTRPRSTPTTSPTPTTCRSSASWPARTSCQGLVHAVLPRRGDGRDPRGRRRRRRQGRARELGDHFGGHGRRATRRTPSAASSGWSRSTSEAGDVPLMRATAGRPVDAGTDDYYHRPNVYVEPVLPLARPRSSSTTARTRRTCSTTRSPASRRTPSTPSRSSPSIYWAAACCRALRSWSGARARRRRRRRRAAVGSSAWAWPASSTSSRSSATCRIGDAAPAAGHARSSPEFSAGLSGMDTPQTWEQTRAADNLDIGRVAGHAEQGQTTSPPSFEHSHRHAPRRPPATCRRSSVSGARTLPGRPRPLQGHGVRSRAGRAPRRRPKKDARSPTPSATWWSARGREGRSTSSSRSARERHNDEGDYAHYADTGAPRQPRDLRDPAAALRARLRRPLHAHVQQLERHGLRRQRRAGLHARRDAAGQPGTQARQDGAAGRGRARYVVKAALEPPSATSRPSTLDAQRHGARRLPVRRARLTTDRGPRPLLEIRWAGRASPRTPGSRASCRRASRRRRSSCSADAEYRARRSRVHAVGRRRGRESRMRIRSAARRRHGHYDDAQDQVRRRRHRVDGARGRARPREARRHQRRRRDGGHGPGRHQRRRLQGFSVGRRAGASRVDRGHLRCTATSRRQTRNADGYNVVGRPQGRVRLCGTFSVAYEGHTRATSPSRATGQRRRSRRRSRRSRPSTRSTSPRRCWATPSSTRSPSRSSSATCARCRPRRTPTRSRR